MSRYQCYFAVWAVKCRPPSIALAWDQILQIAPLKWLQGKLGQPHNNANHHITLTNIQVFPTLELFSLVLCPNLFL